MKTKSIFKSRQFIPLLAFAVLVGVWVVMGFITPAESARQTRRHTSKSLKVLSISQTVHHATAAILHRKFKTALHQQLQRRTAQVFAPTSRPQM